MSASIRNVNGARNDWRIAVALLVSAALVRLALAAIVPLFPDEAYYWVWSRRLAGGYFDHPPGIALLIRAGGWSPTPLGVRLMPVLAGFVATIATAATARRISGDRAALHAAVLSTCLPLTAAGLVLASPDAPLLAAAMLGLYAVVRALEHPPGSSISLAWWTTAGLALGCALCSKYTSVLLAAAVFLALASPRDLRLRLRESGPYVAAGMALLVFMPVLLWNAQNDWSSFVFQLRHGLAASKHSGLMAVLKREGDYLGGQAVLASPIIFVFFGVATVRGLSRRASSAQLVLAVTALLTVAFFGYSALRQRVEPNWPAPAYLSAIVLLTTLPWGERAARWMRGGIVLAAAMSMLIYVHGLVPILPIAPARDPVARSAGWGAVAAAVERARGTLAAESRTTTWAAGDRYQEAALLAFHDGQHRETFALNIAGRPNQYDFWPGFVDRAAFGDNLVLVVNDTEELHPAVILLTPYFETVHRGELVTRRRGTDAVGTRRLWLLVGWKGGWPRHPFQQPHRQVTSPERPRADLGLSPGSSRPD